MEQKIFQHSYNLVQSFYIVGLKKKNDTLISSILSRYPPVDLPYLKIADEVIINVSKTFNNIKKYSIVFQMDCLLKKKHFKMKLFSLN